MKFPAAVISALCLVLTSAHNLGAQEDPGPEGIGPEAQPAKGPEGQGESLRQRDTLTGEWFGLGRKLTQRGITVNLSLTQNFQQNLSGGTNTDVQRGHYAGSYDLEIEVDLEALGGLPGATLFAHAEGAWTQGIDPWSVGSAVGNVNGDAVDDRSIDLTELYWNQSLLDGRVQVRLGKLDITGGFECQGSPVGFDANAYANDETLQFSNAALVNNPSIPLPDYGLGLVVYAEPVDGWYIAAGAIDAQGDFRETGFNTAFHGEDYFFAVAETGWIHAFASDNGTLPGGYRAGLWYDPQDQQSFKTGRTQRDDAGFYLSLDQKLLNENDRDDGQGLGAFARYGWAQSDVNEIHCFWSAGIQYQGLIPTRDQDVLGLGVADGKLVNRAGYSQDHETIYELYYAAWLAPWVQIAPSVQYIQHPGGNNSVSEALVMGLRLQMAF